MKPTTALRGIAQRAHVEVHGDPAAVLAHIGPLPGTGAGMCPGAGAKTSPTSQRAAQLGGERLGAACDFGRVEEPDHLAAVDHLGRRVAQQGLGRRG